MINKKDRKGLMLVLSSPSGRKTSICRRILEIEKKKLVMSVSYTQEKEKSEKWNRLFFCFRKRI